MMKHISICHVFRPAGGGDCTNGGVTGRNEHVSVVTGVPYKTMTFGGKEYHSRPDEDAVLEYVRDKGLDPARTLILCGKFDNDIYTPYLKPLDAVYKKPGLIGPMFGGNYVETDYRHIYRVHDRYETQEEYDALSC